MTREYEIEIQIGHDLEAAPVVYVRARSEHEAVTKAKAKATALQRRWARFVVTGR